MTAAAIVAGLVVAGLVVYVVRALIHDRIILNTALDGATGADRADIEQALLDGNFLSFWGRRRLRANNRS